MLYFDGDDHKKSDSKALKRGRDAVKKRHRINRAVKDIFGKHGDQILQKTSKQETDGL